MKGVTTEVLLLSFSVRLPSLRIQINYLSLFVKINFVKQPTSNVKAQKIDDLLP